MLHSRFERVRFLLVAALLQNRVMFAHDQGAVPLALGNALLAQRTNGAGRRVPFKTKGGFTSRLFDQATALSVLLVAGADRLTLFDEDRKSRAGKPSVNVIWRGWSRTNQFAARCCRFHQFLSGDISRILKGSVPSIVVFVN